MRRSSPELEKKESCVVRARPGQLRAFLEESLNQETDDCIMWPYACSDDGYPAITIARKSYRVNRVVCERTHGVPPLGKQAAHSCGNAKCINKRHLRWATCKENSADQKLHGTAVQGEKVQTAKLTAKIVVAIRASTKKPDEIARELGLMRGYVSAIRAGRVWKHIPLNTQAKDAWRPVGECCVDGCARPALARRMCAAHYNAKLNFKRREAL